MGFSVPFKKKKKKNYKSYPEGDGFNVGGGMLHAWCVTEL